MLSHSPLCSGHQWTSNGKCCVMTTAEWMHCPSQYINLPYLLECKMRFLPEIWCWNMSGCLKFSKEVLYWTGPCQTRSHWTRPCPAKPRAQSPNYAMRSPHLQDITQYRVVIHYQHLGTTYCPPSCEVKKWKSGNRTWLKLMDNLFCGEADHTSSNFWKKHDVPETTYFHFHANKHLTYCILWLHYSQTLCTTSTATC